METFNVVRRFYIKGYDHFDDAIFVARDGGWTHSLSDAKCFKTEEEAESFWKSKGYNNIEVEFYYC